MKIANTGQCLSISEIPELTAVNSADFREEVHSSLQPEFPAVIEIDLSDTRFVDSSGLGALFALYRTIGEDGAVVLRLLNPKPEIQQLLELTQMQELFEIVQR
ncbi:MAG TPA: STAS domain-containing protein [Opitutaceae bacterium]|nr:STAS domain-containing protein [Opitutaceae bacterium]